MKDLKLCTGIMHYPILKILMKVAMSLYFKRIVRNKETKLDLDKPVMVLANHTNGFLDALIVARMAKHKPFFFTRGDAFKKPRVDRFLRSIGLLPINRLSEGRDQMALNDTTNEEATQILSDNGTVVIYAEGKSDVAKVLKPLKKGPFRLAVQLCDVLETAPVVVPYGINYIHPAKPFTTVYLHAGKPIELTEFKGCDDKEKAKASLHLMRSIGEILPSLAWHTEDPEDVLMMDDLLALQDSTNPAFDATQKLVSKVNAIDGEDKLALRQDWQRFHDLGEQLHIGVDDATKSYAAADIVLATITFPFNIVGAFFHWLPIHFAKRLSDKAVQDLDLYSSVFLSASLLFVLGWYLLATTVTVIILPFSLAITAIIAAALSGVIYVKVGRVAMEHLRSANKYHRASKQPAFQEYLALREKLQKVAIT